MWGKKSGKKRKWCGQIRLLGFESPEFSGILEFPEHPWCSVVTIATSFPVLTGSSCRFRVFWSVSVAASVSVLKNSWASLCHPWELDAASGLEFWFMISSGLPDNPLSIPGLLDAIGLNTDEELAATELVNFITTGVDLATFLFSSDCSCILFANFLVQLIKLEFLAQQRKLKWLMLKKQRRFFHSSHMKCPLVKMSAIHNITIVHGWNLGLILLSCARHDAMPQVRGAHESLVSLGWVWLQWNTSIDQITKIQSWDTVHPWSSGQRNHLSFCRTVRNWSLFLAHPTYWRVTSQKAQDSARCWFRILKDTRQNQNLEIIATYIAVLCFPHDNIVWIHLFFGSVMSCGMNTVMQRSARTTWHKKQTHFIVNGAKYIPDVSWALRKICSHFVEREKSSLCLENSSWMEPTPSAPSSRVQFLGTYKCQLTAQKVAYEFLRMSTSRSMLNRREVSWIPLAFLHWNLAANNFTLLQNSTWMEPTPSLS